MRSSPARVQGPSSAWAEVAHGRLLDALTANANAAEAVAMARYMRDQFVFLGIKTPARRALVREVLRELPKPSPLDALKLAERCWDDDARELQYVACDVVDKPSKQLPLSALDRVATLIVTKSWWDTVDALASHVVGNIVRGDREAGTAVMRTWSSSGNLWLARSAVLHQLTYGDATDDELLFELCVQHASSREFFLRKAIGWALRQRSRGNAEGVRAFVAEHEETLSGLSRREALSWIDGRSGAGTTP